MRSHAVARSAGDLDIPPGTRKTLEIPVGILATHDPVHLHAVVLRGRRPGPTLLVCAGIHGDEINGIEIARRLLKTSSLRGLRGTLVAVPIVNVPAYVQRTRYLPDRRDLNRLFPGSPTGSLGARLADIFVNHLVAHADAVIDLHTGAVNRPNLPQVRINADDHDALELARAFHAPVTLLAPIRESTLRAAGAREGIPILIYEGGEALRLDAASIRFGLRGILAVLRHLGMLPSRQGSIPSRPKHPTLICRRSSWERAPGGGIFTPLVQLGRAVNCGDVIGFVADPFASRELPVTAHRDGIVIGRTNEAQADEGDALFHIASAKDPGDAEDKITRTADTLSPVPEDEDDHPVPYDPFLDTV